MHDLIIIGGGPAGITAGIYAARKKLKALLIAKDFSGQIAKTSDVENWPGEKLITGINLMMKFKEHLKNFEIETSEGEEVTELVKSDEGFLIKTKKGKEEKAKAVIVASGRNPRPLSVPGEKEFVGKGVSYCSTCDAPFFQGKTVAIIGGGNTAFGTVIDLMQYAKKIYVLETGQKIIADEINQEKAKQSGKVEIILNAKVEAIKGKALVESLDYTDQISRETKTLEVSGVFVVIGSLPATEFLKNLVDFNDKGEIMINPSTCAAKTPGLFAAGDVTDVKYKQVVIATGEGAKAALSAHDYLQRLNK